MTDEHIKPEPIITHKLKREIKAHGQMIGELHFRAPTGADMIDIGNPVEVDMSSNPVRITHNMRVMGQMIARLAGINPAAVREMEPNDIAACAWLLTDFFVPAL
jgi:hypothetical protein